MKQVFRFLVTLMLLVSAASRSLAHAFFIRGGGAQIGSRSGGASPSGGSTALTVSTTHIWNYNYVGY